MPCRDSGNASGVASRYHPCGSVSLPRETQEPGELQEPRRERDCTNWSAVGAESGSGTAGGNGIVPIPRMAPVPMPPLMQPQPPSKLPPMLLGVPLSRP